MYLDKTILICFLGLVAFSGPAYAKKKKSHPVYENVCYKPELGTPKAMECQNACDLIKLSEEKDVVLPSDEMVWAVGECVVTAKTTGCGKDNDGNVSVDKRKLWETCRNMLECPKQDQVTLYQANLDKGEPGEFVMFMAKKGELRPEFHTC